MLQVGAALHPPYALLRLAAIANPMPAFLWDAAICTTAAMYVLVYVLISYSSMRVMLYSCYFSCLFISSMSFGVSKTSLHTLHFQRLT